MQPVVLRTPRLTLSAPSESDIDAITRGCQDPEVPRWTTVPTPYARRDAEEFVAKTAAWWQDDAEYTWAIHLDGAFAGVIGLHRIVAPAVAGGSAEIGYWIDASARGKGILTEAGRAVVDFAFSDDIAFDRIEWRAVAGNIPSARTARTLGFRYEGLLRRALVSPRGRDDGWIAGLLRSDDRMPQPWPVLEG